MGVLVGPALRVDDAHLVHHLNGHLFRLLALDALVEVDALLDLLANLFQGVEAGHGVLHDHGDLLAPDAQPLLLRLVLGDIHALVHDGAAGDAAVGVQHAQEGLGEHALAGDGLAHDGQGLPLVQVQGAAADGLQHFPPQGELNLNVLCAQQWFS